MRNVIDVLFVLGLATNGACMTRTPIGGLDDAGTGSGGAPGTGSGGSHGTGGRRGTGGSPIFGGSSGGSASSGMGGAVDGDSTQACSGPTGGVGGSLVFRPVVTYQVDQGPVRVALGDLNGDGKPDMAVATKSKPVDTMGGSSGGAPGRLLGTVSLFTNTGGGVFTRAVVYDDTIPGISTSTQGPTSLAIGDLNGDGKGDLAVVSDYGTVRLRLNDGNGMLGAAVDYGVGFSPSSVVLGDVNGDGKNDVVVANQGANRAGDVAVLLNSASDGFLTANYPAGISPATAVIADLNGDGKGDLVVADFGGSVNVLLNAGDGSFNGRSTYALGSTQYSVAVGDLNRDGSPDIAFSGDGGVGVLLNLGNGRFGPALINPQSRRYVPFVLIGDMDADGLPDLAVPYSSLNCAAVGIFLNQGGGSFGGAPVILPVGEAPFSVALADVDGDGKLDVVAGQQSGVSVLLSSP
jgi:FG-GAP-like repeat/FG-GAP repeat